MWGKLKLALDPVRSLGNSVFNSPLLSQQSRNTFILKRLVPPPLSKKNKRPEKLRNRHFQYELVADTNIQKKKNLDIILTSYVEGLGQKGDHVNVAPNYAYNHLLLPKLGVYDTPENREKYFKDAIDNKDVEHSSPFAQKTVDYLEKSLLPVVMSKDNPWTLETWHIRVSFRKLGIHVPDEAITLPAKPISGPDLSLDGKEFVVIVTINNKEKAQVRCRLRHWSTQKVDKLPYVPEYWKIAAEPIFQEDKPILDGMFSAAEHTEVKEENF